MAFYGRLPTILEGKIMKILGVGNGFGFTVDRLRYSQVNEDSPLTVVA